MRCFVAIAVPDAIQNELQTLQQTLASFGAGVRWVQPGSRHLTLKFLGDVAPPQEHPVRECLQKTVRGFAAIPLAVEGLGAFPSLQRPRVFWVGVRDRTGRLSRLVLELEEALAPIGFPRETRSWHPHITLGRVKQAFGLKRVCDYIRISAREYEAGTFCAGGMIWYRSILRPGGAQYDPLAQFPFLEPESNADS